MKPPRKSPPAKEGVAALTKRAATNQFRDLVYEMKLLLDLFPHLRDSYDADELPLNFILKRNARRSDAAKARADRRARRR